VAWITFDNRNEVSSVWEWASAEWPGWRGIRLLTIRLHRQRMVAETSFKVCLIGIIALSAAQAFLGTKGFLAVTRYDAAERVKLARPLLLLCVSNLAMFATSLIGLHAVDDIARPLAHTQAVDLRGEAIPTYLVTLIVCPLYAWVTGWMFFRFSRSKPWRTVQERAILGQVVVAGIIGAWSTLILLR